MVIKVKALVAEKPFAGMEEAERLESGAAAVPANLNASVEENVEAFIRALARQTARKLAADYLASTDAK